MKKTALQEYRALPACQRASYNPAGKNGAAAVRRLQAIAASIAALREARHQARANPQYPAWRIDSAGRALAEYYIGAPGMPRDQQTQYYALPIGIEDASIADNLARAAHPRRSNWRAPESRAAQAAGGDCVIYDIAYKGAHKGRHGSAYAPTMRALARISNDGAILTALIGYSDSAERREATYTLQAGRGYRWERDNNGVRMVRLADGADYHPSTDDVRAGRAYIVGALRERAETRKRNARIAKREAVILQRASAGGIWVSLADSVAAGNCRAGTEAYARRHGLNVGAHYRADALPAPTGSDESRRLALAVIAAQRRQAREIDAGFCAI